MWLVELCGIASVICLLVALWARPAGLLSVVLSLVVVGTAILVSWNDIQQVRAERAASAAIQQEQVAVQPNVTVPPSTPAHSGT